MKSDNLKVPEQELGEGDAVTQEDTNSVHVSTALEEPEVGEPDIPMADAPDEREVNEEVEAQFANSPEDFNKEDLCVNGGRVDKALEELYAACDENNIPCIAFVNFGKTDTKEKIEVAIRGMQVSVDGWMPPIFKAVIAVTENQDVAKLVSRLARDPMALMLIKMMAARKG